MEIKDYKKNSPLSLTWIWDLNGLLAHLQK